MNTITPEDIRGMGIRDLISVRANLSLEVEHQTSLLSRKKSQEAAECISTDIKYLESLIQIIDFYCQEQSVYGG